MQTLEPIADCAPGHAVQSNPVSGSFLQKSANIPKVRGDFRWSERRKYQFRDPETLRLARKAVLGGFLAATA
jgi:hypothetical protein